MKRKLSGLLSIIMLTVLCFGNYAMAATSGNYTYTIADGKATITVCAKSVSGHVEIPDVLGGYTVTGIAASAFANCSSITSITIPSSITTLGDYVFEGCSNLKSVKLPGTIRTIPHYAFRRCRALTDINLENVYVVGIESFRDCSALEKVNLKSTSWIRRSAFYYCNALKTIEAMPSVTEISDNAFSNCKALNEIVLPAKLQTFGTGVFTGCTALENIFVEADSKHFKDVDGVLYSADGTSLYAVPTGRKGSLVAEPTTTWVRTEAAYMASDITEVVLPEIVATMNSRCFAMTGISEFVIPRSVEVVGNSVVGNCSNLKKLYAPSKIAENESAWNGSNTPATFYDYVVTYTEGDEIVDREYVLAGENAVAPVEKAEQYNFYDENGEVWTGENITSDVFVVLDEKAAPSSNTNITVEYSYGAEYITIEDWEVDGVEKWYYATIPADTEYTKVNVIPEDEKTVVDVTTDETENGEIHNIIVTAEDGTKAFYYVSLEREKVLSNNTNITASYSYGAEYITVEDWEVYGVENWHYATIPADTEYTKLDAIPEDEKTTVDITTTVGENGEEIYNIVVTAEDGTRAFYYVSLAKEKAPEITVESVIEPEPFVLEYGSDDEWLYEAVAVVFSNGETQYVSVKWNTDEYDTFTPGEYKVSGELLLGDGYSNPNGVMAYVTVIVNEKYVPSNNANLSSVYYSYDGKRVRVRKWTQGADGNYYFETTVPAETQVLEVEATPEDPNADVRIEYMTAKLQAYIHVTAEDGTYQLYVVTLEREVSAREIVEIPSVSDIWVTQGDSEWAMNLPETVEVQLSDGEYVTLYVEWVGEVDCYIPNTYTLNGYVATDDTITNPNGLTAQINVIVEGIPVPEDQVIAVVNPHENISIDEGVSVEVALPEMLIVMLENGSEVSVPVIWYTDNFDYNIYNEIQYIYGEFITDGTEITNPHGIRPEIGVSIYREEPTVREIVGVHDSADELGTFYIPYGADLTAIEWPATMMVDLDDGTTIDLEVEWQLERVNTTKPGHVSIPGKLVLIDGIANSNNYWVVLSSEVMEKPLPNVTEVLSCSDVTAYIGTEVTASALHLPTQVQIKLDDGNMLTVPVEWDISAVSTEEVAYYPLEGALNLDGYEAQNTDKLTAYVNLDIIEKPASDLSLSWMKYELNGKEYEITAADKTDENTWTVYIPDDEWTATLKVVVSAELTDPANANISISQPAMMTGSGMKAIITVTSVDGTESATYTVNFKSKERTWNVTFMSNGEVVSTQTIKNGHPAYNPGPVDGEGKEFSGWDTDFSCVTGDLTVNALFDEINDDEWSFWYVEKIDEITIDSTMTIARLRDILPTQAWVWFRRGAETMCIPMAIEWEIPADFFALGADTRLLVAKFVTSPDGMYIADKNVNAEVKIKFAGSGEETPRYIISVSQLADVAVPYNATAAQMTATLPSTVSVTLDNGSIQNMKVEWDLSEINVTQPGTYAIYGGIFHGTDVQNPGEHKAKMNVIVNEKLTANGALRAEEITATPGEEITVRITADEDLNMAIGSFMLEFDRGMLELVDYEIGGLIGGSNPMVNEYYDDNGIEKLYVSFMGLNNITAGGDVITLKLRVNENAADDMHYPIDIQNIKFYDFNENQIEVEEDDGSVHVLHYMLGDVNNNGAIELLDAFRVLQYDVGLREFKKAEMLAADVNADAYVNILDALLIQEFDAGLITEF